LTEVRTSSLLIDDDDASIDFKTSTTSSCSRTRPCALCTCFAMFWLLLCAVNLAICTTHVHAEHERHVCTGRCATLTTSSFRDATDASRDLILRACAAFSSRI
jgi:hypothetical protein